MVRAFYMDIDRVVTDAQLSPKINEQSKSNSEIKVSASSAYPELVIFTLRLSVSQFLQ